VDPEFMYKSLRVRLSDEKLWNMYKNLAVAGIPVYMRPAFWFHLLKGPTHYDEIKAFAKSKYDINSDERFQSTDEKIAKIPYEFSWLYYKLNE
jgi:hypothetical protein